MTNDEIVRVPARAHLASRRSATSGRHANGDVALPGAAFRPAFRPAGPEALARITRLNVERRVNMMFAGTFVNAESAQLAFALSRLVGRPDARNRHLTFFGNSTFEALSGALKLARHTSVRRRRADEGWALVVAGSDSYRDLFDPLRRGAERALVPHVRGVASFAEAREGLAERPWSALIVVQAEDDDPEELQQLLSEAEAGGTLRILAATELDLASRRPLTADVDADVYVFGENLTDRQLPFGCFTMTRSARDVWHNNRDSGAHTSTFGGNAVCLSVALDCLTRHGYIDEDLAEALGHIGTDPDRRLEVFARHVNPHVAVGAETFGLALDVRRAEGGTLHLADGRVVLDCAGGTGASLRGHNPPDVAAALSGHMADVDYFALLEEDLGLLTKFPVAFPAVSGATAVDICMTIALLANPTRTKIVSFTGNYSGKTLISMNVSTSGPSSSTSDPDPFRPYFHDVVLVDPFSPLAEHQLRSTLSAGDVALVWFELTHGMSCRSIPARLLRIVSEMKEAQGYLVGVDEVMTGVWRSGDQFLAHQDALPCSDLTSLAKPLSDMTLPIGVALATEEVAERARATDPDLVERLARHLRNNASAHVAWNALRSVRSPDAAGRRRRAQQMLEEGLQAVVRESSLFSAVIGDGTHLRLQLRSRWFPGDRKSTLGQLIELAVSEFILNRTGVLVAQLRFFPAIFAHEDDISQAVQRLRTGLGGCHPLSIYGHIARRFWTLGRSRLGRRRGSRSPQTKG